MADPADYGATIARELNIHPRKVAATVELLDGDATVPFVARYRKEATGGLDEVQIVAIRDRLEQLRVLGNRRETVLRSLTNQEKLTPELEAAVRAAPTLAALEDLYLPFKPKRRTRGMIAREKGLERLAELLLEQGDIDPAEEAARYLNEEKQVRSVEDALQGARDIIAEQVNEDPSLRAEMRKLFAGSAVLRAKVVESRKEQGAKYRDYFDWSEPARRAPSHRILAVRRGSDEGILTLHIQPDEDQAIALLEALVVKRRNPAGEQVRLAVQDSYRRLLRAAMETEMRLSSKQRADEEAIRVFARNLRELLLESPLGERNVLALDPGLRTGCKLVCLDRQGNLLHHDTIYPLAPHHRSEEAARTIRELCGRFSVQAIAVGNGTAGRELLSFCRQLALGPEVAMVMVNESGASVYSASEVAREEFPEQDVTVRGAVSIGRRLIDPLAELVKIDPKSIGVGQYQHDVDQKLLKKSLDDVVASCVNAVGVEVNTASKQLLRYVSGLNERLAEGIVSHRRRNGPFRARAQLADVTGLGPKSFEQAAGFLRIRSGDNPLDASAVHPESYPIVEAMARDLGVGVADLLRDPGLRQGIDPRSYVTGTVGLPTLRDILSELERPGRDPRSKFEAVTFAEGVHELADLKPGMKLAGVVTNVTAFGAFVDIGVHQDGLVHISELSDRFVSNPHEVVKVHQKVTVTVIEVDEERQRIALSMRESPGAGARPAAGSAAPASAGTAAGSTVPGKGGGGNRGRRPGTRGSTGPGKPPGPKAHPDHSSQANLPFADLLKGWRSPKK